MAQPRDFAYGFDVPKSVNINSPSADGTLADVIETVGKAEYISIKHSLPEDADMIATDFSNLVVSVETHFDIPVAEARNDKNLSPEGRDAAYRAAAETTLEELKAFEGIADGWNEHILGHGKALAARGVLTCPKGSEESWDATVRDVAWDLRTISDPLKRQIVYMDALKNNKLAVIHAIESGVPTINKETNKMEDLVDPAKVSENRVARGRKNYPKLAADYDRAFRLSGIYFHAVGHVRRVVAELVPAINADVKPIIAPAVRL